MLEPLAVFALYGLILSALSCFVAAAASGFARGCWPWGVLGPVGWIIAFALGCGVRSRDRRARRPGRIRRRATLRAS